MSTLSLLMLLTAAVVAVALAVIDDQNDDL